MEARPLYRTVAAVGLASYALAAAIMAGIATGGDKFFFLILFVVAVGAAVAAWSWSKGIWISLVASLLLEFVTFWLVFPLIQGFTISALDFIPALLGFVGVWTAIIASILGVVRRRAPREFSDRTKRKILVGAGVIVVLSLASTALTFAGKDTVSATEAAGTTTILMRNADDFAPTTVNVSAGAPTRLLVKNEDPFAHTFTIEDKAYDINEVFGPGSEKVINFTPKGAGRIEFVCEFHPDMKGELVAA